MIWNSLCGRFRPLPISAKVCVPLEMLFIPTRHLVRHYSSPNQNLLIPRSEYRCCSCVHVVCNALSGYFRLKLLEIEAGVDGFMVYDMNLIEPMQKVNITHCISDTVMLLDFRMKPWLGNIWILMINVFSQLFQLHCTAQNQLQKLRDDVSVTPEDLLTMPAVSHIIPITLPNLLKLHPVPLLNPCMVLIYILDPDWLLHSMM